MVIWYTYQYHTYIHNTIYIYDQDWDLLDIQVRDHLEGRGQVFLLPDQLQGQNQLHQVEGWWLAPVVSTPCIGGPAPCVGGPAPCGGGLAPCGGGPAPCAGGPAPCGGGPAPCGGGPAPCVGGPAPCGGGLAPCTDGPTPCAGGPAAAV